MFRDVVGAYSRDLEYLRGIGTYCIKPIEDDQAWSKYMSKQSDMLRHILKKDDYPRNVESYSGRDKIKRDIIRMQEDRKSRKPNILNLMSMRAPEADS